MPYLLSAGRVIVMSPICVKGLHADLEGRYGCSMTRGVDSDAKGEILRRNSTSRMTGPSQSHSVVVHRPSRSCLGSTAIEYVSDELIAQDRATTSAFGHDG